MDLFKKNDDVSKIDNTENQYYIAFENRTITEQQNYIAFENNIPTEKQNYQAFENNGQKNQIKTNTEKQKYMAYENNNKTPTEKQNYSPLEKNGILLKINKIYDEFKQEENNFELPSNIFLYTNLKYFFRNYKVCIY